MSQAPAAHASQDAVHAHDAHAFTGEPTDELPPDEPRTPGWVPVLGLVVFTLAAVGLVAQGSDATEAAPAASASAQARGAAPPSAPTPAGAAPTRPAAPGGITAEQQEKLRRAMAGQQGAPGAAIPLGNRAGAPPSPPGAPPARPARPVRLPSQ